MLLRAYHISLALLAFDVLYRLHLREHTRRLIGMEPREPAQRAIVRDSLGTVFLHDREPTMSNDPFLA